MSHIQSSPKHTKYNTEITGAEAVVLALIDNGADTMFGYPGGAIMPVYDALYDYANLLKHYLVRHEQGAIHAAQGYARVNGKTGVVIATSGPGATNLITGIADAQIDSTPLVCITGQVAAHLLGTDAFQETDVIGISMPVTKWSVQVSNAADIPAAISKAFYIANSGRPGPVLVDITKNAQFGKLTYSYQPTTYLRSYKPIPVATPESIQQAAQLINAAKKPYILCGQGVILSGAQQQLIDFAQKANIPVACTLLGLSAIPASHPLYVGYLGMHGNYGPNILTNECDVLIAIGMRFDDRVTGDVNSYAKQAKIVHFDLDAAEINKIIKADVGVLGDAKASLESILPLIEHRDRSEWLNEFKKADAIEHEKVINNAIHPTSEQLKMAEVIHILQEKTQGKAVVVTDVGQHQMIASRYYKFEDTRTNVTSGGLGTMGFGLPAAMGAKVGAPQKQVVAIIGDGGFQMTLQELGTIMQDNIAVKILILNNSFLGMVRQWQQLFFDKRYSFTEMTNPNFVKLAEAYNIPAQTVSTRDNIAAAIQTMLDSPTAYLLEVKVETEGNVFPMVPTGASISNVILE